MFTKVYINDVEVDTEMEDTETDTLPEGSDFVFSGQAHPIYLAVSPLKVPSHAQNLPPPPPSFFYY